MGNTRQSITISNSGITTLPHAQSTPVTPILQALVTTWAKLSHSPILPELSILNKLLQAVVPSEAYQLQEISSLTVMSIAKSNDTKPNHAQKKLKKRNKYTRKNYIRTAPIIYMRTLIA